ncbi:MAG: tripartite tricarboxylate transporter TctB family protein [Pseudomonadota bacterium]
MTIRNPKDFWAGLMFMAFGLAFMVVALGTPEFIDRLWGEKLIPGYQMGSAVRMGPAYFPVVLGGMLAALGAIVFFRAYVSQIVGAAAAVRLPFNIVDLAVAVGVFVVMTYLAKWLKVSHDYAMLGSALVISVLAILFRPNAKALTLILACSLAFAYLLKPLGLVLSAVLLVFIGAFGGHGFKAKEVAILAAILVVFSVLVFVKALTLPFPVCPAFIDRCPIQ